MTKEEAIEVCKRVRLMFYPLSDKVSDAMKMAIEALKQPEVKCLKCDHLKAVCMHGTWTAGVSFSK